MLRIIGVIMAAAIAAISLSEPGSTNAEDDAKALADIEQQLASRG